MTDETAHPSSNQWGTRERLDAWLKGCRARGELGTAVRIDFELVKEALTEIDRLLEIYRRERKAHAANLKEQQKCEAEILHLTEERDFHQRTSIRLGDINVERAQEIERLRAQIATCAQDSVACWQGEVQDQNAVGKPRDHVHAKEPMTCDSCGRSMWDHHANGACP